MVAHAAIGGFNWFIGGLSAHSSFNYETTRLIAEGAPGAAALNAICPNRGRVCRRSNGYGLRPQLLRR
jgi:fluoride ion exporter CrcB/FEX